MKIELSVMKQEDFGHYVAVARKFAAEMWIHRNIPGGIDGPIGRRMNPILGRDPNQMYGGLNGFTQLRNLNIFGGSSSYGTGYGYISH